MKIPHELHPEKGYYMDDMLFRCMKAYQKRIEKDKDVLILVCGDPGNGKDTIAQQCAYVLTNGGLSVDDIKWTAEDYYSYCRQLFEQNKSKGTAVIHSEAREAATSMSIMSKKTKEFMDFIYECRQMNMFHFLLGGNFFDFPKSIVMQRARCLIYVKETKRFNNGDFLFFSRSKMKKLYMKGKDMNNMAAIPYDFGKTNKIFRGRFPRFYTVDEDKYREIKKSFILKDRFSDEEKQKKFSKSEIMRLCLQYNPNWTTTDLAEKFNVSVSHVSHIKSDLNIQKDNRKPAVVWDLTPKGNKSISLPFKQTLEPV